MQADGSCPTYNKLRSGFILCPLNSPLPSKIFLGSCSAQVYFPPLPSIRPPPQWGPLPHRHKNAPQSLLSSIPFWSHSSRFIENLFPCFSSSYTLPSFKSVPKKLQLVLESPLELGVKTQDSNLISTVWLCSLLQVGLRMAFL